jgi:hypothetical protein
MISNMILTLGLLLISTSRAHPTDHHHNPRLEDLQCRCLSISTESTKPTLCTYMEAIHHLDFYTASTFASEHNLKLHFASQDTVTKVLAVNRPLPTEVLESLSDVPEVELAWVQSEMRIVCGFDGEVERMGRIDDGADDVEIESGLVGAVVAGCMGLVGVYMFVAWLWARYVLFLHDSMLGYVGLIRDTDSLRQALSNWKARRRR